MKFCNFFFLTKCSSSANSKIHLILYYSIHPNLPHNIGSQCSSCHNLPHIYSAKIHDNIIANNTGRHTMKMATNSESLRADIYKTLVLACFIVKVTECCCMDMRSRSKKVQIIWICRIDSG